jgi:hypothetical protein
MNHIYILISLEVRALSVTHSEAVTELESVSSRSRKSLRIPRFLQWSSSFFAVVGGVILAANVPISGYGFIFLALSSGQMLISSLWQHNHQMIVYSAAVFIFVDCLGVYRWVLQ